MWNVTGYVFGPYTGRTFFAPFFGTTPLPDPQLAVAD